MTTIQIERLTTGTTIHKIGGDFGPFGGFAEVQDIQFDGESYIITARMLEGSDDHVSDDEFEFIVGAGDCISFGGRGEPKLRAEEDIAVEEWQAKADMIGRGIDRGLGKLNELQGHQCREIDEAPLVAAVAEAIGVPALESEAA